MKTEFIFQDNVYSFLIYYSSLLALSLLAILMFVIIFLIYYSSLLTEVLSLSYDCLKNFLIYPSSLLTRTINIYPATLIPHYMIYVFCRPLVM